MAGRDQLATRWERWTNAAPIQIKRRERHDRLRLWLVGVGASTMAAGAGLMYLFDPQLGRRRRHLAADRSAAAVRRTARHAERWGRRRRADANGTLQRMRHLGHGAEPAANDEMLADRVKSVIFRDPAVPQGRINLNVQEGVVVLRGQLDRPEQVRDLTEAARKVPGVRDVESYLHLPQDPAPTTPSGLTADT